jgi:sporulation protein YunB
MSKSIIISGGNVSETSAGNGKRKFSNRKKKKTGIKILIFLAVLISVLFGIMKYSEYRLRPIIKSMAEAHARTIGARVTAEAINEEIARNNLTYDDLISFEKSENGKISALKTNIMNVNKLKSRLSAVILNKLSDMENVNLYIPVGNLLNGEFLSGRGPEIEVILLPVGSVATDITNVFTTAGINQTRHQIMLEVLVSVSIIMPFSVENTDISTSVSIAETIIVGDVPNMYMESGADKSPNIAVSPNN